MRLKSLELQGYKTFASRTLFEFAGAVTCVVGPNGSGKSNIADSLRWVLGEQSYMLLRGKKTEDMIFSGSEQRPRAGMASATVVFNNSDGWLPIDFSEVAITRRAYRDGQNEYLINGQKVRLKDVSELLAQSGLSERTYTIIGQGVVDAALALKAEERRRLFEEAAGIGLHRSRREEALRRLETTRRNLDRVQDILAELGPRLRYLERQARRAQEYEQVRADLRLLLRDWYGYHWHQAQQELTDARDGAHKLEAVLEKARVVQAAQDEQLNGVRSQIQGLRARLNAWHRQQAGLHNQREELSRQSAVADERLRSFQQQQTELEASLSRLSEEQGAHETRAEQAQAEQARLQAELDDARSQAAAVRQALQARLSERSGLERSLQTARQNLSGLNNRQGALQARLTERQSQARRQVQTLEAAAAAVAAAEKESQHAQAGIQKAREEQQSAQDARSRAAGEVEAARKELARLEQERNAINEKRTRIQADEARLKAELNVLEQAERALSGYGSGAQVLLRAAKELKLGGARGALSSQIEAPAELETALAAALGEYLDAVILESGSGSDQALDLLARETARGGVLPLDALAPPRALAAGKHEGVIGLAADLVSAPAELRPAMDLLLGQTLIVEDRSAARRVLERLDHRDTGVRAVTLKGEVFYASGPVFAGQSGRPTTLSRKREQKDLSARLEAARAEQAQVEAARQQAGQSIQDSQAALAGLVRAENDARTQFEKKQQALAHAQAAVEQAARQKRFQEEQHTRLKNEAERGEADARKMQADLEALEGEISKARDEVRRLNNDLAGLSTDEYVTQVNHWNTQVAVTERAVQDATSRLDERRAALSDSRRQMAAAEKRLQDLAAALGQFEQDKALQRQAESEVTTQIDSLRVLIDPAEAELDRLEGEQAVLQEGETASRAAVSKAEHNHAQARIMLAKRQESLETWRRRIEDDFGLVAFEYADEISGPTPLPLDGMVEQLPRVKSIPAELEENLRRQRAQLRRMGPINPEAQAEYKEVKERHEFMTTQVADLNRAEDDIRQVIAELDTLMQKELRKTFDAVAEEFTANFKRLFGGGTARLVLTDPDDMTNTGIDIEARLPGRRMQGLSLLSGGERSLTASSLVFALLKVSPTPFCLLDEVDAMLDEANVGRFRDLLRELSQVTQFIVVTHNRNTVQAADVIYGITMGRDSASQVISLKLDEVDRVVDNQVG